MTNTIKDYKDNIISSLDSKMNGVSNSDFKVFLTHFLPLVSFDKP